jgi:hypothetical protein
MLDPLAGFDSASSLSISLNLSIFLSLRKAKASFKPALVAVRLNISETTFAYAIGEK